MHSIKHNRLEAAVRCAVQQQVHLAVSYSEMIARSNTAPVKKSQSIRLEELIAAKERELAKISRYKPVSYTHLLHLGTLCFEVQGGSPRCRSPPSPVSVTHPPNTETEVYL